MYVYFVCFYDISPMWTYTSTTDKLFRASNALCLTEVLFLWCCPSNLSVRQHICRSSWDEVTEPVTVTDSWTCYWHWQLNLLLSMSVEPVAVNASWTCCCHWQLNLLLSLTVEPVAATDSWICCCQWQLFEPVSVNVSWTSGTSDHPNVCFDAVVTG